SDSLRRQPARVQQWPRVVVRTRGPARGGDVLEGDGFAAGELIGVVGRDGVVARPAVDRVGGAVRHADLVVAVTGPNRVGAVAAADVVVAGTGIERVVALVTGEQVVPRASGERVRAQPAREFGRRLVESVGDRVLVR